MKSKVDVTKIFDRIMADTMGHVFEQHGEKAVHHLFFELYNHTFSFLEREYGFNAVRLYWEFIADHELSSLEHLMKTKGFKGMEEYWRSTLGQEGADYEMEVTGDSFKVIVKHCPPTEWFKAKPPEAYPRYCEHCDVLYRRVGKRCGFEMQYIPPNPDTGACCGVRFTRRKEGARETESS